ncbi:MAG: 50S ribosomal protein L4 [Candidatus Rokubacteria bacterium]|nr:50S ribosomal protein L4 [Chloroflexota bacterium]MBM4443400.1 50S ribosomal protein L4 [Candidatus Rokubacteria bacterium]
MKLSVVDAAGKPAPEIEVDDAVFGIEPNAAVVHQALLAQLAARRAGTAKTRTRGEVVGSTRKIRRQKGLGMARQGAIRAPHHRGGGIVFGPKPRSYAQRLPKRMRRLAIRSVLSSRAQESRLVVVSDLGLEGPSTRALRDLLAAVGAERSALVVVGAADRTATLSARNLDGTRALPADTLNVADVLAHRTLVMTVEAVRRAEALWGGERAAGRNAGAPAAAGAEG